MHGFPEEKEKGAKGFNPLKTARTMIGLEKLQKWLLQKEGVNELNAIQGLQIDKVYSPVTYLDYYRSGLDRLNDNEVERFFNDMHENEGPAFLDVMWYRWWSMPQQLAKKGIFPIQRCRTHTRHQFQ